MLAEPTGKIIEVIQLIKNDLRTIEPNEARSLCTLFSNIKIVNKIYIPNFNFNFNFLDD